MYQKVYLLLNDVVVVAMEGNEWCLGGPRVHRTLFRFSELHNSHFLHRNSSCSPHKLNHEKQTWAEDQKLKINLEWPNLALLATGVRQFPCLAF